MRTPVASKNAFSPGAGFGADPVGFGLRFRFGVRPEVAVLELRSLPA